MSKQSNSLPENPHPKQVALPGSIPELDQLKQENEALKKAVAEATNALAWYATPLNWARRFDAKTSDDKEPAVLRVRYARAQACLETLNSLLK